MAAGRLRRSVVRPSCCPAVARRRRAGRSRSIATGIRRSGSTPAMCSMRTARCRRCLDFIADHRDAAPLVYSTADPAEVSAAQDRYRPRASGRAFRDGLCRTCASRPSTPASGAWWWRAARHPARSHRRFGPHALEVGPEIDTGVPVLVRDGEPRLAFALKSGNFGGDDFFATAVEMLKGGSA